MWIRSQDKEVLANCNSLNIAHYTNPQICDSLTDLELGEYETIERAKEVLDEIMEQANAMEYLKVRPTTKLHYFASFIYQMPEK